MQDTVRLFIAIKLPPTLQNDVARLVLPLHEQINKRTVKWVPVENLHLTLRFLGDVPKPQIPELKAAMQHAIATHVAFSLSFTRLGFFASKRKPRVLWLGLQDQQAKLVSVQRSVQQCLSATGYEAEKRCFKAHLTLARFKDAPEIDLDEAIASIDASVLSPWPCDHIALMQSDLTPNGAVYTTLFEERL